MLGHRASRVAETRHNSLHRRALWPISRGARIAGPAQPATISGVITAPKLTDVRSRHRQYLIRRIVRRLQANTEGGLSRRALRRAEELVNKADVRVTPPRAAALAAKVPLSKLDMLSSYLGYVWSGASLTYPRSSLGATGRHRERTLARSRRASRRTVPCSVHAQGNFRAASDSTDNRPSQTPAPTSGRACLRNLASRSACSPPPSHLPRDRRSVKVSGTQAARPPPMAGLAEDLFAAMFVRHVVPGQAYRALGNPSTQNESR